jgi:hypothetical protein
VTDGDILKSINSKSEFEKPETLKQATKTKGGGEVRVKLYSFLNPGAVWKQASNATPRQLYLRDSAPYPLRKRLN